MLRASHGAFCSTFDFHLAITQFLVLFFEWPLKTGFTVVFFILIKYPLAIKVTCKSIDLHEIDLLVGIFLFKLGKNEGICHWDRGLFMAPETPLKYPKKRD